MRLWKRASGALKDQNSIWVASLSRRTPLRNPEIDASVIKATNHNEYSISYKNVERIFQWVRLSDDNLLPVIGSISTRMRKTRCWVVALKGLILLHGVFSCRVRGIYQIGRLPFDLSNFEDSSSKQGKNWAHCEFIRAYYAFLDQRSAVINVEAEERVEYVAKKEREYRVAKELVKLQRQQHLLDMLLQMKPVAYAAAIVPLVIEAMDGIVIEIFDVYSKICRGIAGILLNIYSASRSEAKSALGLLLKANSQGDKLTEFFDYCRTIGVMNVTDSPKVEKIPDEDIRDLEDIINGLSERSNFKGEVDSSHETPSPSKLAIVVRETESSDRGIVAKNGLKTIITHKWEKFDEDLMMVRAENQVFAAMGRASSRVNPFVTSSPRPVARGNHQELPDLINF